MIATCHPNRFAQARGLCKCCYEKWLKDTNPGYRRRQMDNSSAWKLRNPEKWQIVKDRRKAKVKADPLYRRERMLIQKYGINLEQYDDILKAQNGLCAICFRAPGITPLHVDHNHTSGMVRGLLCHQCNWYLGVVDRDPGVLPRLDKYRNGTVPLAF